MEDITDQVMEMDKALSSALMNTECSDPIVAVISLSRLLCELLIELGMDDDEQATAAFRDTLRNVRKEHTDKVVH